MADQRGVSRRRFLGTGVGAASAVLLKSARARAADDRDDIRCGMIGTGGRGGGVLMAIHKSPGVRVTALCDTHEGRLHEAAERVKEDGPRLFSDYRALIDFQELDAIFVETPCYLHAEMVKAVLESGRHCYGEKPMALTVKDLNEMLRLSKSSTGIYQVGTQLRYAGPWCNVLEEIKSGLVGKPILIRAHRHNAGDMPHDRTWFFNRDLSGDTICEQAVHEFDLFCAVFGGVPERAAGFGGQALLFEPQGRNIMDHYALTLDYGKNAEVGYTHSWIAPEKASGWHFVVHGDKGAVEIENGSYYLRDSKEPGKIEAKPKGDSTQLAVDGFFRCVREGGQPVANAETGRNAALTALLGRKAIYEGRTVTMKELLAEG